MHFKVAQAFSNHLLLTFPKVVPSRKATPLGIPPSQIFSREMRSTMTQSQFPSLPKYGSPWLASILASFYLVGHTIFSMKFFSLLHL